MLQHAWGSLHVACSLIGWPMCLKSAACAARKLDSCCASCRLKISQTAPAPPGLQGSKTLLYLQFQNQPIL